MTTKSPVLYLKSILDEHNIWQGEQSIERNQYLVKEGKVDSRLYYVISGSFRATMHVGEEEHTIRFGYEGSIFGSLDSFLTGGPSQMNIQAIKKSEIIYASKSKLMAFFTSSPERQYLWSEFQNIIILQQLEREVDLLTHSPEQRYKRVLARSPQLFQHIPHKYIAAYLRMTPETLSRIRKS